MKYTILHRRGTTSQWNTANPVLAFGEVGVENTGATLRSKVGDGITSWASLPYADEAALEAAHVAGSNAKAYADAGDTESLSTAKAYSDSSLTAAKSYTDVAVANSSKDTGWRNISDNVASFRRGKLYIRRTGSVIEVAMEGLGLTGTPGSMDFVLGLGSGWRPIRPVFFKSIKYWGEESEFVFRMWTDAKIRGVFGTSVEPQFSGSIVYTTTDAWPTSLPGTPG